MALTAEEERTLLASAVAGDRTALQRLLLVHYETIGKAVRLRFDDRLVPMIDPDDVIQEVLIKVHRHIRSYQVDERDGFKAWLRRIAANCINDAARRCQR